MGQTRRFRKQRVGLSSAQPLDFRLTHRRYPDTSNTTGSSQTVAFLQLLSKKPAKSSQTTMPGPSSPCRTDDSSGAPFIISNGISSKRFLAWIDFISTLVALRSCCSYSNPAVFRAMAGEMLFIANLGVDFIRMDA